LHSLLFRPRYRIRQTVLHVERKARVWPHGRLPIGIEKIELRTAQAAPQSDALFSNADGLPARTYTAAITSLLSGRGFEKSIQRTKDNEAYENSIRMSILSKS
jgi:hypothetical protein